MGSVGSIGAVAVDSIGVAVDSTAAVAEADNIVGGQTLWDQTRNLVVELLGENKIVCMQNFRSSLGQT